MEKETYEKPKGKLDSVEIGTYQFVLISLERYATQLSGAQNNSY